MSERLKFINDADESSHYFEAIPFPMLLIVSDGRIDYANIAAKTLFGAWVRGRSYISILRQPEILNSIDHVLNEKQAAQTRFVHTQAGLSYDYRVYLTPVADKKTVAVLFENISHENEMATLRRDFVANVSHELRSPLTALMGFIETLQGSARFDVKAQERFLGLMQREAMRMNRLVSDLLSLSKLESQARTRPNNHVDFSKIVRHALDTLPEIATLEPAQLSLDLPDHAPVLGDFDQLQQVVINLVENALKYGGQPPELDIRLQFQDDDHRFRGPSWVLSVRDNGPGIEAWHIPRLSERFYRVDTHRSRQQGGTGLGLAIVKHILKRHRGRLHIESTLGEGSTFTIFLARDDERLPEN